MNRLALIFFAALVGTFGSDPTVSFAVDKAVLEAQQRRIEVIERVSKTVVAIFGASGGGGGSGVLISPDGYALTNFHVTSGAGDFMKCGLNDGRLYDAVIVGIDPTGDVAMIKLLGRDDFPAATLGDSDEVRVGDWAYAMGNPFLLATDFRPTITYGIVSGVHRYQEPASNNFLEYTDCIQVDSSINPGNSGGPLFSDDGKVIGINGRGSFEKRGRVNSGAGYAISINQIKHFMEHLKSGRIVDHATLGATVTTRTDGTVMVANILENSEAYKLGLRSGDELISFAGRPIRSVNQFKNVLGIYPKGWKLPLTYRQEQDRQTIYPRLRALHRASEMVFDKKPVEPPKQPKPDAPKDDPKKPKMPQIPGHSKPKPPAEYAHMLVKKPGFANYYFNEQEQDRIFEGLNSTGDFSSLNGSWTIAGQTGDGQEFELIINDQSVEMQQGNQEFSQKLGLDGTPTDLPPGSGGLLTSLAAYRLLLTEGKKPFSDTYYLGAEPLDGNGPRVDVLISKWITTEIRWYFDQTNQQLLGFDTYLSEDALPCEVRIQQRQDVDGRQFPSELLVRHIGETFATYQISKADFSKAEGQK
ncbi:S1C family serine protease [Thalassoroseus pseudoceratinae]|uniref:S1C family serine protease n=1 Tax=Thalassoroseus pseudoceratinae TaxID=2713176 RepID=UPI001420A07C|nr:trypsin-like peptidase domain-containing protein [Thalassoroseus pseudoceratinae]